MRFRISYFMGVALLIFSGCTANDTTTARSEAEQPENGIVPATQPDSQAIEKINTLFSMTPAAQQAKEVAVAQCLKSQGYTWDLQSVSESYDIRSDFSPRPLSVEEAQERGYQTLSTNSEQNQPDIDDATWAAYMGNPENGGISVDGIPGTIAADGCLAQSYKAVFGSAEAGVLFESGIQNLPLPYIGAAQMDSKQEELNQRWSACMKDHYGIEIQTPDLASVDTSMDSHQLAMYDAQCRQEVNYEEVTTEILNAYLTTFLTDNEGIIDQLTQAKQTAEKNAPEILGR